MADHDSTEAPELPSLANAPNPSRHSHTAHSTIYSADHSQQSTERFLRLLSPQSHNSAIILQARINNRSLICTPYLLNIRPHCRSSSIRSSHRWLAMPRTIARWVRSHRPFEPSLALLLQPVVSEAGVSTLRVVVGESSHFGLSREHVISGSQEEKQSCPSSPILALAIHL